MPRQRALTIRQFDRLELDLPLTLSVDAAHCQQVQFAPSSGAINGEIRGRATDLSTGGLGASTKLYLPRMCEATVRIFASTADEDLSLISPVLEHRVKVRRVNHGEGDGEYELGLAFIAPDAALSEQIATIGEWAHTQSSQDQDAVSTASEEEHHG